MPVSRTLCHMLVSPDTGSPDQAPLAPFQLPTGADADLICGLADGLIGQTPENPSQALKLLYAIFPNSPLVVRAAALHALMRS